MRSAVNFPSSAFFSRLIFVRNITHSVKKEELGNKVNAYSVGCLPTAPEVVSLLGITSLRTGSGNAVVHNSFHVSTIDGAVESNQLTECNV